MQTSLNLLTRDGAVYVSFKPALSATQYAELLELVKRPSTDQELRDALSSWAAANALAMSFSELPDDRD